jgi:hypothetical protein
MTLITKSLTSFSTIVSNLELKYHSIGIVVNKELSLRKNFIASVDQFNCFSFKFFLSQVSQWLNTFRIVVDISQIKVGKIKDRLKIYLDRWTSLISDCFNFIL